MKCYKLTSPHSTTRNGMIWGENITHTATGTDPNLCSDGWIHFYMDIHLAVIMNPAHGNFSTPILWEAEASGEILHEPLKSGSKTLTTIRQIPLPEISLIQRIAFAIYCTKEVYKNNQWNNWADKWLSGEDRSKESAVDAASAASAATTTAYYATAAAYYATAAAYYATTAVVNSFDLNNKINFRKLLNKAMLIK